MRVRGLVPALILVFAFAFSLVQVPLSSAEDGAGTSPSIAPGVAWGFGVGDMQLNSIITWNWTSLGEVNCMLAYPNKGLMSDLPNEGGLLVNVSGGYVLGWSNTGTESTTVTYRWTAFSPQVSILKPAISPVNTTHITVSGTFDGYAAGILVGLDEQHFRTAFLDGRSWSITNFPINEGRNTIIVRPYYWVGPVGSTNYSINATTQVVLDTGAPYVNISGPVPGEKIRGGGVDVLWNSSDIVGIKKVDMSIDGSDFTTVHWGATMGTGLTHLQLGTGEHTVRIRSTDIAGNQATTSVTFSTDSKAFSMGGPYYGIPSIGLLVLALGVGVTLLASFRKPKAKSEPTEKKPQ